MQNYNSIIDLTRKEIQFLTNYLKNLTKEKKGKLKEIIFNKLWLFSIIEENTKNDLKILTIIDLISYLFINQILFYQIYSILSKKVPQLSHPISDLKELKFYFNKIQENEFNLIYSIDIISIISDDISLIKPINGFIKQLKNLDPALFRQDLIGRLFQESLPNKLRKKIAVFYTRPTAAELLAQLAIDTADERILDLACGSGTLLVAAYRRKLDLLEEKITNPSLISKEEFQNSILDDIMGLDIMPFAAYLAAVNLSLQNLNRQAKKIKIGIANSLNTNLESKITPISNQIRKFSDNSPNGIDFKPLDGQLNDILVTENSNGFSLENVNIVIMNPPFTRKELLSKDFKHNIFLKWSNFRIMGYWGYFILLADEILKINGKIAAVIPSGFFRGRDTLDLRRYLFQNKNYKIRYIVKLSKDVAFTESAIHRDFLLILEKGNRSKFSVFGMIYLNKSINKFDLNQIKELGKQIKNLTEGKDYENTQFKIRWINHSYILKDIYNLWHIVGFSTPEIREILYNFYRDLLQKGEELDKLDQFQKIIPIDNILRGLEPNPPGLFKIIFLINPLHPQRIARSKLIIDKEQSDTIQVKLTDFNEIYNIPRNVLEKGLKTHTYQSRLIIEKPDYIILDEFNEFQSIKEKIQLSEIDFSYIKQKGLERLAHLFIIRRFGFSKGTKLICFYSEEGLIPSKNFYCIKTDLETAKILSLWFNSTFSIIQILLTRRETGGIWGELVEEDLIHYYVPKLNSVEKKHLLEIFSKIKNLDFPSITEQFESCFNGRLIIDQAFLKIFGFNSSEIDNILRKLYTYLNEELRNLEKIKK